MKHAWYRILGGMVLAVLCAAGLPAQQAVQQDALKLYREKKYSDAITICEKEIAANPNNMDSYSVLCWSLIATDRYLEAEQRATEARKLNSYDTRLMEALGEAKYFLGKNNEALSMFQRFIANASETSKDIGLVYYYMGEIYVRQSRFQHADIAFSAAVRSAPTKDYWWTRLGYAREKTGDYKSALTAYEKALSLNASQYDAKNGKERCQEKL
jgi:tetratricopeptide (TPR) repeat protein